MDMCKLQYGVLCILGTETPEVAKAAIEVSGEAVKAFDSCRSRSALWKAEGEVLLGALREVDVIFGLEGKLATDRWCWIGRLSRRCSSCL